MFDRCDASAAEQIVRDDDVALRLWNKSNREPRERDPNRRGSVTSQALPRSLFLAQMRRERLRADRTQTVLSLVVFQVRCQENTGCKDILNASRRLLTHMRETDTLGYLDAHVLALLLPDTTEQSAKAVVERVAGTNDSWLYDSVTVRTYPDELFDRLQSESKNQAPMDASLFADPVRPKPLQTVLKRCLDVIGALVALAVLSPVMLITAAAIKLTSPGPVIFKQVRLGKDFTPFVFYKFRSMYTGADDRVHRDYLANLITGKLDLVDQGTAGKSFFKMTSDQRITRVGKMIRKTSIDELPQLFNVIKGEMSLVGPRPPLPYEANNYQSWHFRRILEEVKPGITGLWQVEGRSQTSFDDMVRLDLRYSRDWSILLDLKLLLKTIKVVLECRGAA